jgi:hypothetical protein
MTSHEMFVGRLQIYSRGSGLFWQCFARVGGKVLGLPASNSHSAHIIHVFPDTSIENRLTK